MIVVEKSLVAIHSRTIIMIHNAFQSSEIIQAIAFKFNEIQVEQKFQRRQILQNGRILLDIQNSFNATQFRDIQHPVANFRLFGGKYNVNFPMDNMDDFSSFNDNLKEDGQYRTDFVSQTITVFNKYNIYFDSEFLRT